MASLFFDLKPNPDEPEPNKVNGKVQIEKCKVQNYGKIKKLPMVSLAKTVQIFIFFNTEF